MIQKLLFLFVFLPFLVIKADPREAEASEYVINVFVVCFFKALIRNDLYRFQEFYPNELEEKLTRGLDQADMTIKFQLEHDLPLSSKDDVTFTNRGLVEIELSSTNMKPKVSFSQVPSLSKEQIDTLEVIIPLEMHIYFVALLFIPKIRSNITLKIVDDRKDLVEMDYIQSELVQIHPILHLLMYLLLFLCVYWLVRTFVKIFPFI
jgi:hypothetical protein